VFDTLKEKTVKWLRWSEQYTKTDMVYLAKGGGWLTTSKVFSILGGLALATAFANLIPQETYGTYKFFVSAVGIIGAFTLSDMSTAVSQAAARGFNGALQQGTRAKLRWGLGIFVVGLATAGYYYLQANMQLAFGMLMIAVLYPIRSSFGIFEAFLKGKKDFKRAGLFNIGLEAFQIISMVTTLFLTNNVLWVLAAFLLSNTIGAAVFHYATTAAHPQANDSNAEMLTYGKHLSLMNFFSKGAKHIDKILVWHFLGPVQLAIYSFAELPISKLENLISSLWQVAFPKFSNKNINTLQNTLDYKVFLLSLVFLCIAGVYIIASPFIFQILFPKYLQAVPFSQVYALGLVLFAGRVYENALKAHAKTKWIYINEFGGNTAKIISLLILLPMFGVWGAIISLLVWELTKTVTAIIGFKLSTPTVKK
jgi:O-antigen/teichoic acid export membrane protein